MPELSTRCPYCYGRMRVAALACDECGTNVSGDFHSPRFLELSAEQQAFAIDFILASGSLKEMAARYNLSYPTVRARLDRLIEALQSTGDSEEQRRAAVLDAVEEKRLSPQEAKRLLAKSGPSRRKGT